MKKLRVVHVSDKLGLGGTEKTLQIFVRHLDREMFDVSICGLFGGGERGDLLSNSGVEVCTCDGDYERLVSFFRRTGAEIVHYHRAGHEQPLVPTAARDAGVPLLIDHSIFGAVDTSPSARLYDHTIFVSQMIALRYLKKKRWSQGDFWQGNSVLYNPIDLQAAARLELTNAERGRLRAKLSIPADAPVVGRMGRAHTRKWGTMFTEMMPYLVRRVPDVCFLIVGATAAIRERIAQMGLDRHCRFLPETAAEHEVSAIYQVMDCLGHTSLMGESFGLVIAEAMSFRKPVVTHSVPRGDNAQIELVDHEETGLVANHPRTYAEAVAFLLQNSTEAERMGRNGQEKVKGLFEARAIVRQLERLYLELAVRKGLSWAAPLREKRAHIRFHPSHENLAAFEVEYAQRLRRSYGHLRLTERPRAWLDSVRSPYQPWRTAFQRSLQLMNASR